MSEQVVEELGQLRGPKPTNRAIWIAAGRELVGEGQGEMLLIEDAEVAVGEAWEPLGLL